eukprot:gene29976-37120_t
MEMLLMEQLVKDIHRAMSSIQIRRVSIDRMQFVNIEDSTHRIGKDEVSRQISFDASCRSLGQQE